MHPLNLWFLPGRLGRTFQVTNKGLCSRFVCCCFFFTAPHRVRFINHTYTTHTTSPHHATISSHIAGYMPSQIRMRSRAYVYTRRYCDASHRKCRSQKDTGSDWISRLKRHHGNPKKKKNRKSTVVRSKPDVEGRGGSGTCPLTICHPETLEVSARSKSKSKIAYRKRESNVQVCTPGHRSSWQMGREEEGTLAAKLSDEPVFNCLSLFPSTSSALTPI